MSRLRRAPAEDGFSLVEILVSIMIFAVVATAVLPLLLAGIRGGTHSKLTTQAKNIGQERLELMRNLPYYVAQQNGDYRDVLDVYFRDLDDPGTIGTGDPCATRRYVVAGSSYRCELPDANIGGAVFEQVVETTFVNAAGAVVVPRPDYDSQVTNLDAPASNLLDVRITTTWTQGAESRDFVLRSRIAKSADDIPLITSKVRASAVKVTSTTATGTVVTLEAGLMSGDGSKSTASSASASAVGAYASLDSGATAKGAEVNLSAPLDDIIASPPSTSALPLGLDCTLACFGDTKIKGAAAAKVSQQVPQVGVDGSVVGLEAELSRSGGVGSRGFDYSNTDLLTASTSVDAASLPLVTAGAGTSGPIVSSTGSLNATAFGATSVTAKVSSKAQAVQIFPTSTAPAGVVQLTLSSATLTCVDGNGRDVVADWSATVQVHTPSGYVSYVVKPGAAQLPAPGSITTSTGHTLDRYIGSWSGLVGSADSVAQESTPGVSGNIPAVLTVLTAPTRAGDPTSVINITVGSLSCEAEDNQ